MSGSRALVLLLSALILSSSSSCCSAPQSCPFLCDPMDCSTPGFPVHHDLPELAQTHVHWVSDAMQPSHLLLPSSLSALNLSQHQGLFQWDSLHIRWFNYWNFSFSPSNVYSELISCRIDWFALLSKGISRVFSSTTIGKHQFFGTPPSLWFNSHIHTWLLEKT